MESVRWIARSVNWQLMEWLNSRSRRCWQSLLTSYVHYLSWWTRSAKTGAQIQQWSVGLEEVIAKVDVYEYHYDYIKKVDTYIDWITFVISKVKRQIFHCSLSFTKKFNLQRGTIHARSIRPYVTVSQRFYVHWHSLVMNVLWFIPTTIILHSDNSIYFPTLILIESLLSIATHQ